MVNKKFIGMIAGASLINSVVWATGISGYINGNKLLDTCQGAIHAYNLKSANYQGASLSELGDLNSCSAYIQGVVDALSMQQWAALSSNQYRCYNATYPGITTEQSVGIVYKYLQANPELLNDLGALLVETAWSEAFPMPDSCIKQK